MFSGHKNKTVVFNAAVCLLRIPLNIFMQMYSGIIVYAWCNYYVNILKWWAEIINQQQTYWREFYVIVIKQCNMCGLEFILQLMWEGEGYVR